MKPSLSRYALSGALALFLGSAFAINASADPAVAAQTQVTVTTPDPAAVAPNDLSTGTKQVLKLFQAGTSAEVLTTYAQTSGQLFSLSADDIIYLNKVGVPSEVVTTMLQTDRTTHDRIAQQSAQQQPTTAPQQARPTYSQPTVVQQPAPTVVYNYDSYPYYYSYPNYGYSYYPYNYGYYPYYGYGYSGYRYGWPNYYSPFTVGFGFRFGDRGYHHGFGGFGGHSWGGFTGGHSGGWSGGHSGGWSGGHSGGWSGGHSGGGWSGGHSGGWSGGHMAFNTGGGFSGGHTMHGGRR